MSGEKDKSKKFFLNKELLVTSAVAAACLFLVSFFPKENLFQEIVVGITFFFIIPALYVRIILKRKLREYGMQTGNARSGIIWAAISAGLLFLLFYLIFNYTEFRNEYRPPQGTISSFRYFIFYEVLIVGFLTALYEFFFKGFLMFSLRKRFGYWAIAAQFVVFALLLVLTGSFDYSFLPLVASSLFSGLTAYKSQSLIYSFAVSFLSVVITDAVIIRMLG